MTIMQNRSAIRSWRQASRYCRTPITSLRRAIERGELAAPSIRVDGGIEFDIVALDAYRASRGEPVAGASTASPANVVVGRGSTRDIAPWLLHTVEHRDRCDAHDEDDERDGVGGDHDYDDDRVGGAFRPAPLPLGSTRTSWPPTPVYVERVVEVQVPPSADAIAAAIEPWRLAWRASRVRAIAGAIAFEASALWGVDPHVAAVAAQAAAEAVGGLTDAQLGDEVFAMGVAREVGHRAGAFAAAAAQVH